MKGEAAQGVGRLVAVGMTLCWVDWSCQALQKLSPVY